MFWIQVVVAGLIGAGADIVLKRWAVASGLQPMLWLESSVAILVFATLFGITIRRGIQGGYSLSMVALVVLLVNIGALVLWDRFQSGISLTSVQWAGFAFGILTAICFELG